MSEEPGAGILLPGLHRPCLASPVLSSLQVGEGVEPGGG